ncbi:hypothetical protein [Halalkalibacterium halodurans]|uniref:hypothetical protein n=1 Tax=Halalkalibacterium halodurans TaxID=86665 RepID=UPI00399CC5A2
MDILDTGTHTIRGIAWTGAGSITSVKVSTDQGHTWREASMDCHDPKGYAWIPWSIEWNVSSKRGIHHHVEGDRLGGTHAAGSTLLEPKRLWLPRNRSSERKGGVDLLLVITGQQ